LFLIDRDAGVNFFDTAELYPVAFNYGKTTEIWMGNWLENRVAAGKLTRDKIFLATKVNPMGIGCPIDECAGKPHGYDREIVFASCKASIERMKCEYIDLYQFHWPTRDVPIFGTTTLFPWILDDGASSVVITCLLVSCSNPIQVGTF
jgi:aryl-alcohol dehydrogenase-like predicted oxidoreductase